MLSFQGVCVSYGRHRVLQDVSFTLRPHRFTAVIGRNGSGKSTLVACVNQQLRYTGEIDFSGRSLALMTARERAGLVSILPQTLAAPPLTVEELVALGRSPYLDLGRRLTRADCEQIEAAIADTGIAPLCGQTVDRLSGGERQKAYLAMILAQNTRVMVLDEPTTYMDMEYEGAFLQLLTRLKYERKKTLMVVMHNLTQAFRCADDVVALHEGRVRFAGTAEECLRQGVVEELYHLVRHTYSEDGQQRVFFTAR